MAWFDELFDSAPDAEDMDSKTFDAYVDSGVTGADIEKGKKPKGESEIMSGLAAGGAAKANPKLLAASMALKVLGAQQKRKEMDMLNRFEAQKSQRSGIQNQLANLAGFYQKSGIV